MAGAVPAPVTAITLEIQLHLYRMLLITVSCIGFEVVKVVLSQFEAKGCGLNGSSTETLQGK